MHKYKQYIKWWLNLSDENIGKIGVRGLCEMTYSSTCWSSIWHSWLNFGEIMIKLQSVSLYKTHLKSSSLSVGHLDRVVYNYVSPPSFRTSGSDF